MLRVLTLNLQHGQPGRGAGDGSALAGSLAGADITDPGVAQAVLEALAEQIRELAPDVVALQEVDLRQARSGRLDQTAVLARALGMPYHRFAATYAGPVVGLRRRPLRSELGAARHDVLGPVRAVVGAPPIGYGNALISRYPVSSWHVKRLGRGPSTVVRRGERVWDPRSYRVLTATSRVMVAATIEVGGTPAAAGLAGSGGAGPAGPAGGATGPAGGATGPAGGAAGEVAGSADGTVADTVALERVSVASAHLATRGDTAATQLLCAWEALAQLPGPHVLAGDYNLRADRLHTLAVARRLGQGETFPAGRPTHRIDHVLTDPWPVGPDGQPLARQEATAPGRAVLLGAVGWGTRTFLVSDHKGTWVDLAPLQV